MTHANVKPLTTSEELMMLMVWATDLADVAGEHDKQAAEHAVMVREQLAPLLRREDPHAVCVGAICWKCIEQVRSEIWRECPHKSLPEACQIAEDEAPTLESCKGGYRCANGHRFEREDG